MQTPHRKPLRPVNRVNTPSSAPQQSSNAASTSKPTRSHKPSRIPSFTPHHKPRPQQRSLLDPEQESRSDAREAGNAAVVTGGAAGGRRVRRQVMRLSELMAAVRMTPIKEREEEYGLGEAEVNIDCYSEGLSAQKRTAEQQQQEEIRQYEAMLSAEEEQRVRRQHAVDATHSDDFHTASEFELQLSELQQAGVDGDDDRRSSMFAATLLPVLAEWTDDRRDASETEQEAGAAAEDESTPSTLPQPSDSELRAAEKDSEVELRKPTALAAGSAQEADPVAASPLALVQPGVDQPSHALPEGVSDSFDKQPVSSVLADEPVTLAAYDQPVSISAEQSHDTTPQKVDVLCEAGLGTDLSSLKSIDSPSCPILPTPYQVCSSPSSSFDSVQPSHADSAQLQALMLHLTAHSEALQRRHELEVRRLSDERVEAERETEARLQKEEEDYKSLYFAYCQLEREHNALKAKQPAEPEFSPDECEVDEEQEYADEAVDYAAMSEEKVVPAKSPEPALLEQLSAELEQLRLDKAEAEARVECRLAAAEAELMDMSSKYEQLQVEHALQSTQLADALAAVEASKVAQAQVVATHELLLSEKDGQIGQLQERVATLNSDCQQLVADQQARQQQLEASQSQLCDLCAEKSQLTSELTSAQHELQRLQAHSSEQRDTIEYAQNEKLALEQELSDLRSSHTTLLDQQSAERAQYESLLCAQRRKDADMLCVIDDSIANIEQLRSQLANSRLALARCQHTLAEQWDDGLVRDEQLYALSLELRQTSEELQAEAERVVAMAAQMAEADGTRAALESRLRCSEDRVQEVTALMATVEQDRRKDQQTHSTLTGQLLEAERLLEEQKQRQRELSRQLRQSDDRSVRLEGDIAQHEQKQVRLQSELQRERDERRREVERRRETEAALDALQQHSAGLEGQQEALTQSIQLRPLQASDEYERRLRDKEALILRLGKTVKQMHRHIEVDVQHREAELARTIRQQQRVFVLVVKILSKAQYAADNDVRRLLEVLQREGAAAVNSVEAKAKEVVMEDKATQ